MADFEVKRRIGVRELARKVGISPTTASRVLRGDAVISMQTYQKVVKYLDVCPCCGTPHKNEPNDG